jgi:uncharacterized protein YeaO (DUF488 family)
MKISKYKARRDARKIWEKTHNCCLLPGIHIHHKDGNPFNNSLSNLQAVTSEEHWKIHYERGDVIALHGKFIQGADNWRGRKHTKESREKIRKSKLGKTPWNKGIPRTQEARRKASESQVGLKNHRFGHKFSSEEIELRASKNGSRVFEAFKDGILFGRYVSKNQCERETGVLRQIIKKILDQKQNATREKWHFKYV